MKRRMRTLLVLALVVAVVPLAVAGGKGEAAGAAQPIKIGAPLPLTGAYAADGEHMLMGLELAVDDLNAQGGLLGRPVELVKYDIEDLLAETVTASAEYLIKKENVDVVIEGYGGWGPDFIAFGGKYDVPFFHGSGSVNAAKMVADNPADYWNMFQVFSVEANYGIRAYEGLSFFDKEYKYPNKKIAIIHGDLEWDLLYTDAVAEFAKNDGWEVVVNETVPYGTTDWGPILLKIRDTRPAAICCSILSVSDIASFVVQFMENPTPSLLDISYMVVFTEVQEAVGEKLKGVMGYVTSYPLPGAENEAWKERFKTKFGMEVPLTTPPSTYDTAMVWAQAVKAVGDTRKYKEISDYIRKNPYTGLLGTYNFNNPEQTVRPGPEFPIAYAQYKGGGELAFFGVDPFVLPPWIKPAWAKK
jgi:ABC-type branched-subunit amino acid transport system substrate-binding protein